MAGLRCIPRVLVSLIGILLAVPCNAARVQTTPDPHGGVKMGVVNRVCDNAKSRLVVDWDSTRDYDYKCYPRYDKKRPVYKIAATVECIPDAEMPKPLHKCMTEAIYYNDQPPRAGPHRPLWPVYGEYKYVPPQRWVHSLEHGGAVFLYHPCADPAQIKLLKSLAKGCLRKHIITPYRKMPPYQSFGVITYGCRLLMGQVDPKTVIDYVKRYALHGPEDTPKDGQYDLYLVQKANIVSDLTDSNVCPHPASYYKKKRNRRMRHGRGRGTPRRTKKTSRSRRNGRRRTPGSV